MAVHRQSALYKLCFPPRWLIKLGVQIPRQKLLMCTLLLITCFCSSAPGVLALSSDLSILKREKRERKDKRRVCGSI